MKALGSLVAVVVASGMPNLSGLVLALPALDCCSCKSCQRTRKGLLLRQARGPLPQRALLELDDLWGFVPGALMSGEGRARWTMHSPLAGDHAVRGAKLCVIHVLWLPDPLPFRA